MIPDSLRDSRILVVDDEPDNIEVLEPLLRSWGLSEIVTTTESSAVVELCALREPDLILLDLRMPPPDGFEVMAQLRPWTRGSAPVPILVLTGDLSPATRRRALTHGARDFLGKPFDPDEVRLRTVNLLEVRQSQRQLLRHGELLEERIRDRSHQLEAARKEVLERLGRAAEYRDDSTGEHTRRVGRTACLIARELGLAATAVDLIALAAPLHDVGKIGIPDSILLKPGQLDERELELMRQHVIIGAELLGGSSSPVLEAARKIALTHHERWDGTGYPSRLRSDEIPIEGRIVAIADVFDALTHPRPYKQRWSVERALEVITTEASRAFDPDVVDAFMTLDHEALLGPVDITARGARAPIKQTSGRPAQKAAATHRQERDSRDDDVADPGPALRMVSLAEAASALSVSAATLRRWSDTGRIGVQRTAGGHRRFPLTEIRRIRAVRASGPALVRVAMPPDEPIAALADLLSSRADQIRERAARAIYHDRAHGWFVSDEARTPVAAWSGALCEACLSGNYSAALVETRALARAAELAGTSLLERNAFVERFAALALQALVATREMPRSGVVASRRLFASVRHVLLEDSDGQEPVSDSSLGAKSTQAV